jgi:dynactin complex subunit
MAIILISIILIIYYVTFLMEAFGEKYYENMIETKRQFFIYLIPFSMWVRAFINEFNKLK